VPEFVQHRQPLAVSGDMAVGVMRRSAHADDWSLVDSQRQSEVSAEFFVHRGDDASQTLDRSCCVADNRVVVDVGESASVECERFDRFFVVWVDRLDRDDVWEGSKAEPIDRTNQQLGRGSLLVHCALWRIGVGTKPWACRHWLIVVVPREEFDPTFQLHSEFEKVIGVESAPTVFGGGD